VGDAERGVRSFADSAGARWTVEVTFAEPLADGAPPGLHWGAAALRFRSAAGEVLAHVPGFTRWLRLSDATDAELRSLLGRAGREAAPRGARGGAPVPAGGQWLDGSSRLRGAWRRVVDAEAGAAWRVAELDTRGVPGARGPACLLFDGDRAVRRVWDYPPDWATLPDAALLALSWGR
jgi:hypothetical protein